MLIRGAAGSGKTTTALLRLRTLVAAWAGRREALGIEHPVSVLVLTFNRTLKGYIKELVNQQIPKNSDTEITVDTFARWSKNLTGINNIVHDDYRKSFLHNLCRGLHHDVSFLVDEADYVLGRFLPTDLASYVGSRRDGRGIAPRVDAALRHRLLNEVIQPYTNWKRSQGLADWNDIAVSMSTVRFGRGYDIIVADECQDFSANQVRAIQCQQADISSTTFILDATQRIYPRGFTWREAGISLSSVNTFRLGRNYRNTIQIARFAAGLVEDLPLEDDGTIPNIDQCREHGPLPQVVCGLFRHQAEFAISHIIHNADLRNESVAFLHPRGEGCFNFLRFILHSYNLPFVELTRQGDWPEGAENIGLCTLHSAKGLEFDHVVILGLNQEMTPHGEEDGDDRLSALRRLIAMGIGRARKTVIVGYKLEDASTVVKYFKPGTFQEITL